VVPSTYGRPSQSPHPVYIQRQGRREQERGEEEERGELQA